MEKIYICVCEGNLPSNGEIDLPIGRSEGRIIQREVRSDGKPAKTIYEKIGQKDGMSVALVKIETGRTHQIRVHFSHMGHPLAGDWLYGKESKEVSRHLLHLWKVGFVHPITDEKISLTAPVPNDMGKYTAMQPGD